MARYCFGHFAMKIVLLICISWTACLIVYLMTWGNLQVFRQRIQTFGCEVLMEIVPNLFPKDDLRKLQEWRINWKQLRWVCEGKMAWSQRDVDSKLRTVAAKSYVANMDLQRAGSLSRLWIQSVDTTGTPKTQGGDSWRVYVRHGPSSIAPIVIDNGDGLYEVIMLIMEPGAYKANIKLDYTLCDGLREPPPLWFINGTDYGTYMKPKDGILGNLDKDYINSALGGNESIEFVIEPQSNKMSGYRYIKMYSDHDDRCMLWDGQGYWKGGHWLPYKKRPAEPIYLESLMKTMNQVGTLYLYGDSLAMRFTDSIQNHPICTRIFKACNYTYNWIYEVKDKRHPLKIKQLFNKTVILEKVRSILQDQEMNQSDSVFILSFGVHFPISLTFDQYKDLIDSTIYLLNKMRTGNGRFKGNIIWKSAAAIEREKITRKPWPSKAFNYTMFRFLTPHRNQLFHSYAMSAMCLSGIPVLDVYQLTAANQEGTLDFVHYNDTVFRPAIMALQKYVIKKRLKFL